MPAHERHVLQSGAIRDEILQLCRRYCVVLVERNNEAHCALDSSLECGNVLTLTGERQELERNRALGVHRVVADPLRELDVLV
eukprot:1440339-Prymnesium_polylepis.1